MALNRVGLEPTEVGPQPHGDWRGPDADAETPLPSFEQVALPYQRVMRLLVLGTLGALVLVILAACVLLLTLPNYGSP